MNFNSLTRCFIKRIYRNKYLLLIVLLIIIIVPLFFGLISMLFFLILLSILNIILSVLSKYIPKLSRCFELIMFNTVLAGLAYGSKVGAIFGFISAILYYFAAGKFSYYVTVFAPLYAVVGALVPLFSGFSVLQIGLSATISYTVISSIAVILLFSAKLHKALIFAIINTFFNLVIFKYFAPILLKLMS